jgi:hydrogenase maturation protease
MENILLIAIGNSARGDDGLGWAFADHIRKNLPEGFDIEYRYQLQVEDADLASRYSSVIFADATEEVHENGFAIREAIPAENYFYSSHLQTPEAILYLSGLLYGCAPEALIVSITGYDWELGDTMGARATDNLKGALEAFQSQFKHRQTNEHV